MELFELKLSLIKEVIMDWQKKSSSIELPAYLSLVYPINQIDIKKLIPYIGSTPLLYFQEKDQKKGNEYLAVGQTKILSHKESLDTIDKLCEENPQLNFYGGLPFDTNIENKGEWSSFYQNCFFLPLVEFHKKNSGEFCCQVNYPSAIINHPEKKAEFILSLESVLTFKHRTKKIESKKVSRKEIKSIPGKEHWSTILNRCLSHIKNSDIKKVVLARKNSLKTDLNNAEDIIYRNILSSHAPNYLFYFKTDENNFFISLTPERLFKKENDRIYLDVIAGTRPRDEDQIEDKRLATELKFSVKEMHEHHLVTGFFEKKLPEICHHYKILKKEDILKLKHVQHLHSKISGTLKDKVKTHQIIKLLHPTPAVGGIPWKKVKNIIRKWEPFERGLYAAPIGRISRDSTELAVGIRSALFENGNLHFYGGAGIVNGSNSSDEWHETEVKMENFYRIFVDDQ